MVVVDVVLVVTREELEGWWPRISVQIGRLETGASALFGRLWYLSMCGGLDVVTGKARETPMVVVVAGLLADDGGYDDDWKQVVVPVGLVTKLVVLAGCCARVCFKRFVAEAKRDREKTGGGNLSGRRQQALVSV